MGFFSFATIKSLFSTRTALSLHSDDRIRSSNSPTPREGVPSNISSYHSPPVSSFDYSPHLSLQFSVSPAEDDARMNSLDANNNTTNSSTGAKNTSKSSYKKPKKLKMPKFRRHKRAKKEPTYTYSQNKVIVSPVFGVDVLRQDISEENIADVIACLRSTTMMEKYQSGFRMNVTAALDAQDDNAVGLSTPNINCRSALDDCLEKESSHGSVGSKGCKSVWTSDADTPKSSSEDSRDTSSNESDAKSRAAHCLKKLSKLKENVQPMCPVRQHRLERGREAPMFPDEDQAIEEIRKKISDAALRNEEP